ncbi:DUF6252 family protein [Aequorivita echinoideorum]|uniref:CHRD domain-containing protein n=1 Tax=Aequorivita echinoideorum TaxID=1549647 RepID=A0ABS5S6C5_9FLAO|nr:DUF6252 family protein [Aequorivita echinoideorum]MBT0608768.1 hypothetical protein [Aequorivita echinoideorum]
MKKIYFLHALLLGFLAFQFISCENEPLEGDFPQEDPNTNVESTFIKAKIDGEDFFTNMGNANFNSNNQIILLGGKPNGQLISISISNPSLGEFDLATDEDNRNSASYKDEIFGSIPFATLASYGGSGQINLSLLDTISKTVSGTFSYDAFRIKLDENGEPMIDENGENIYEGVNVTNGEFSLPII